jgi:hypothetical protein
MTRKRTRSRLGALFCTTQRPHQILCSFEHAIDRASTALDLVINQRPAAASGVLMFALVPLGRIARCGLV